MIEGTAYLCTLCQLCQVHVQLQHDVVLPDQPGLEGAVDEHNILEPVQLECSAFAPVLLVAEQASYVATHLFMPALHPMHHSALPPLLQS